MVVLLRLWSLVLARTHPRHLKAPRGDVFAEDLSRWSDYA